MGVSTCSVKGFHRGDKEGTNLRTSSIDLYSHLKLEMLYVSLRFG